jgi:drug/metabolite transporter (DMT)-like permease
LAPFGYLRLPLAVVLGIALFGEFPDAVALGGIGLILFGSILGMR